MKKLVLIAALAVIMVSCNSGKKETSHEPYSKVFQTNVENVDSLSKDPNGVWRNLKTVITGVAHSGSNSSKLDSIMPYSLAFQSKFEAIDENLPKQINLSAYGCALKPNSAVSLVLSVGNNKVYKAISLDTLFTNINEWKPISANFSLPNTLEPDDEVKIYVWNRQIGEFLVDDYKLEFVY